MTYQPLSSLHTEPKMVPPAGRWLQRVPELREELLRDPWPYAVVMSGGPFSYGAVGRESSPAVAGGLGAECIRGFGRTEGAAAGEGLPFSLEFTEESHPPAAHRTLEI